jgi:hypothetical protein
VPRHLYIVDLDRTVFDTKRFFNYIVATLNRTHSLDREKFQSSMADYVDPESGGYDPHAHHEELLGLSADDLDGVIKHELAQHDYVFPDAADWLTLKRSDPANKIVILTVGRARYQQLKLDHAPAAAGLPIVVIPGDKGGVIKQRFLGHDADITLIDDAAQVFEELAGTPGINLIRIARPGEKYSDIPCPPEVRQITNFGELS